MAHLMVDTDSKKFFKSGIPTSALCQLFANIYVIPLCRRGEMQLLISNVKVEQREEGKERACRITNTTLPHYTTPY
jgi:hypothetical protein